MRNTHKLTSSCGQRLIIIMIILFNSTTFGQQAKPQTSSITANNFPPSVLSSEVSFDLNGAFQAIEESVPKNFGGWGTWTQTGPKEYPRYKFEAERSPFEFRVEGNSLLISSTISYRAAGQDKKLEVKVLGKTVSKGITIGGSCGDNESRRRIRVTASVSVTSTPDWKLASKTTLIEVSPLDECKITILDIDVTDRVVNAGRRILEGKISAIDNKISQLNFRERAERLWQKAQNPLKITDGTWLQLNPSAVQLSPFSGQGSILKAKLGIVASPRIIAGTQSFSSNLPLPQLTLNTPPESFNVLLEGKLSHDLASAWLVNKLRGKRIYRGDRYIEVTDASIYGAGDVAVMEIAFKGSAKGKVYFHGQPAYDAINNTLSIPDLDYDLKTKNVYVKLADWLKHESIRNFFRERATWSLGTTLSKAQADLVKGINRDLGSGVTTSGEVQSLEGIGVKVTEGAFITRVRTVGRMKINVRT